MRKKLFDLAKEDVIVARFIEAWLMGYIEWAELLQRLAVEQCEHYNHIEKRASNYRQIDIQNMEIARMSESSIIKFICDLSKAKQNLIEFSVYTDQCSTYFIDEIGSKTIEHQHY